MDPNMPSSDHAVPVRINGRFYDFYQDDLADSIVVRFFAFLPYGRGTLVSRVYVVKLPDIINTMEREKLVIYELEFSDWPFYSDDDPTHSGVDALSGRPTLSAPFFLEDHFGESPLATSHGPNFQRGSEGLVYARLGNNGMIELNVRGAESMIGGGLAGSFYFGLQLPPRDSGGRFSVQAFDDSDGLDEDAQAINHGVARSQYTELINAVIPQTLLPKSVWENPAFTTFVAGATWIDNQMNIHYSKEIYAPLSNFVPPTPSPVQEEDVDAISSLCPPGSVRNLIEDAGILDVSSEYSIAYSAKNTMDGDASTEWATQGDGNRAYITFELRSEANIVSVGFHSRTMGSSAQIYVYQVEVGDSVTDCELPDATRSYSCEIGDRIGSRVKFQAIRTSGGNVGAVDISINGCLSDEIITRPPVPPTIYPTYPPTEFCDYDVKPGITFPCTVDSDCYTKVRSRLPFCPAELRVPLCGCYASSSRGPFDECEGEGDDLCKESKCANSCENFNAYCYQPPDESSIPRCELYLSDSEDANTEYQPIINEILPAGDSPSLSSNTTYESHAGYDTSIETNLPGDQSLDEAGQTSKQSYDNNSTDTVPPAEYIPTCASDDDCIAAIRTLVPKDSSSYDIDICDCYALSRINPLDECEGNEDCVGDQSCGSCEEVESSCSTGRCILVQIELEDATPSPTVDYDIDSGALSLSSVLVAAAALLSLNVLI